MTMTEATTRTLEVPGATLTYDVRPNESSTKLPLFSLGGPMGAGGFGSLASYFNDRAIITYDPRGSDRSVKPDMTSESPQTITPTTCIGSSRSSAAGLSTCSPAAAARSMRSRCSRSIPRTFGRSWRTSRRSRPCCRIARTRRRPPRGSRHVPAQRLRRWHGPLHRRRQPRGRVP